MMDKETLIQRYFEGSLSEEEKLMLSDLLETDREFKEQFEFEKDLRAAITDGERASNKEKLRQFEGAGQPGKEPRIYWKRTWALAASVALLIGAGWLILLNRTGTTDQLYATYFEKYPNTEYSITRGDSEDTSIKRKAFEAYEAEDFDNAIQFFRQMDITAEAYIPFYLAQAYMGAEDWEEAEDLLRPISDGNSEYASEALWYLALVELRQDEESLAGKTLKQLIARGDYKKNEAVDLLEQLAHSPEE